MSDFGPFQPPENVIFDIGAYFEGPIGRAQGKIFEIFFSEIFKKFLKFPKIYSGHPATT